VIGYKFAVLDAVFQNFISDYQKRVSHGKGGLFDPAPPSQPAEQCRRQLFCLVDPSQAD
jgi:hypothetical protein